MARFLIALLLGLVVSSSVVSFPAYSFSLVVVMGGVLLGGIIISVSTQRNDANFLFSIFLVGFLLRIVLAIALYLYSLPNYPCSGFFAADGWGYHFNGLWLARMWQRGIHPDLADMVKNSVSGTVHLYDYYNGLVSYLVGKSPLTLFFINCFIGSITTVVIYMIAKEIFSNKIAKISSILYCFWPSLILWSTQNLKEPIIIFSICAVFLGAIKLRKRFSPWYLLLSTFALGTLLLVRGELCLIFVVTFFIYSLFAMKNGTDKILYITVLAMLAAATMYFVLGNRVINATLQGLVNVGPDGFNMSYLLEKVTFYRSVRAEGGSAFLPGWEFSNVFKLLLFLPIGLFVVFLSPFPWQVHSSLQIMAAPEMLCWYFLIPFTIRGIIYSFGAKREDAIQILLFIFCTALALGLIEGNIGTLFRHRSVIMGLFLIFTAAGIDLSKKKVLLQKYGQ